MMKILAYISLSIAMTCVFSQQLPQYSQYNFNYFIQNPAVGGAKKSAELQLGYRTQWVGFEDAPPQTSFVSVHAPIHFDPNVNVHHTMKPHHGIGAYVFRDQAGLMRFTGASLAYSYHMNLTRKDKLSVGAFVGFKQYFLDGSGIVFTHSDIDPKVTGNTETQIVPDASIGIWYHSDKLFAGISANQILNNQIDISQASSTEDFGQLDFHYVANVGMKLAVNSWVDFMPSVLAKIVLPAPLQLDFTGRFLFDNTYSFFVSARNLDAAIVGVGYMYKIFEVGYAFDLTANSIQMNSAGTHEVMLTLYLNKKQQVECPKFF